MKPPGAGHWQNMPGHVPRRGGPCRAGGPSFRNAVGVAWWWARRVSDKFCVGAVGVILTPQLNILSCSESQFSELLALRSHLHVTDGETEAQSKRDWLRATGVK